MKATETTRELRSAKYTVVGSPIALLRARPNYSERRMWDSQRDLKVWWKCHLDRCHDNRPKFTGPIQLTVYAFIDLPQAKKTKKSYLHTYHHSPPDSSNLLKWVEDAAQGILFDNDCLIADARCIKLWSNEPRTTFIIKELSPTYQLDLQVEGLI